MAQPVSAAATTTTAQPNSGLNFWALLIVGLGIMIFGNFIGRLISTRMHKTVSRKVYFSVTIPFMVVFVLIVYLLGAKLSIAGQYILFGVYIFAFSILGGFVEAPPMPQQSSGKRERPSIETGKTVEGKGKDINKDSPVDDKTEH